MRPIYRYSLLCICTAAVLSFTLVMGGCSQKKPERRHSFMLNSGRPKMVEGETTRDQIYDMYGAPQNVTRTPEGNDVWIYNRVPMKGMPGYDPAIGNPSQRTQRQVRVFRMQVEFDQNGIVKRYTFKSYEI